MSLGDIPKGDQRKMRVHVTNETGIGLQYVEQGNGFTIDEYGYIDPGYHGEIRFTLKPNGTHDVYDTTKPFI